MACLDRRFRGGGRNQAGGIGENAVAIAMPPITAAFYCDNFVNEIFAMAGM